MSSLKGDRPSKDGGNDDGSLPLRWAIIFSTGIASGFAVDHAAGLVPGVTVGLAVAGFLHKVLRK